MDIKGLKKFLGAEIKKTEEYAGLLECLNGVEDMAKLSDQLKAEIKKSGKSIDKAKAQVDKINGEITTNKAVSLEIIEGANQNAEIILDKANKSADRIRAEYEEDIKIKREALAKLNKDIANRTDKSADLGNMIEALDKELEDLRVKFA